MQCKQHLQQNLLYLIVSCWSVQIGRVLSGAPFGARCPVSNFAPVTRVWKHDMEKEPLINEVEMRGLCRYNSFYFHYKNLHKVPAG